MQQCLGVPSSQSPSTRRRCQSRASPNQTVRLRCAVPPIRLRRTSTRAAERRLSQAAYLGTLCKGDLLLFARATTTENNGSSSHRTKSIAAMAAADTMDLDPDSPRGTKRKADALGEPGVPRRIEACCPPHPLILSSLILAPHPRPAPWYYVVSCRAVCCMIYACV